MKIVIRADIRFKSVTPEKVLLRHISTCGASTRHISTRHISTRHISTFCAVLGIVILSLFTPQSLYSQDRVENIEIYFRQNSFCVDNTFNENGASLDQLSTLLKDIDSGSHTKLTKIEILGCTSPEYDMGENIKLAARRIDALRDYLLNHWSIPDSLLVITNRGVAWDELRGEIIASDVEHRDEVIDIIDNVPEEYWDKIHPDDLFMTLVDSRNKHLMDLRGGRPYNYMYRDIFPKLRRSSLIISYRTELHPMVDSLEDIRSMEEFSSLPQAPIKSLIEVDNSRRDIRLAVKTNLLYDLLITPNIDLEVPIGNRWSVAGEWIFPWWVTSDNGNALQILSGQVEGRYWFGDRDIKPQLTGWFASFYAGGGLYDVQWNGNGYQGEFYIASGLGVGYAHPINKRGNLRMEYSLGIGYLKTNYRYYEGMENNQFLVWQYDGNYTWVGPTKAKVSLVWFIDWQRGGYRW